MYDFTEIEKKWQKYWEDNNTFKASNTSDKEKYYYLVEFPYPSGAGLHVGHVRGYTALDTMARKKRMMGYNVLFPMGWDAFGAPAEQYAIKNHIHPKQAVAENIGTFKSQIQALGISFDWSREFSTTDEDYYKWTQWQFLQFFKHGLAYKAKKNINWCPICKTGLSNEDSSGGVCERCGSKVVQKEKEQWMLKMSEYSEQLIEGLDETDFREKIKVAQVNWIGKSVGAEVDFSIKDSSELLRVYTTRPDTLYGVTFMVVAPEHPLVEKMKDKITNYNEIIDYRDNANKKTEFERTELVKEKTGVKIDGINAINPVNGNEIEIWVADYVMMTYGTGAIMAVPAHDDRDFDFAKKFNIPVVPVIEKITGEVRENETFKNSIVALVYDPKRDKYLTLDWKELGGRLLIGGTLLDGEDKVECAKREIIEETGYSYLKYISSSFPINHHYYAFNKNKAFEIEATGIYFELLSDKKDELNLDTDEVSKFDVEWVDEKTILSEIKDELHANIFDRYKNVGPYIGDGKMINSGILTGIDNKKEAIEKMIQYLESKKLGQIKTNYRLQDWIFSRQRFWGEPIPLVHCNDCGWVPVDEKDLPVTLPSVVEYEPTDDGESPLATITDWVNTKCPKCGKEAKRETDTMPNWAGSSWYWLRYMDPKNSSEFVSKEALNYWGMVDYYNGGMEHATRHLLYARFWHRFLYDIGLVPTREPFKKRVAHGMILGEDGQKMSKSKGNVVNPDDMVREYGTDALRSYEMFIGDYEKEASWSENGLKGCKRFLDRVYRIGESINDGTEFSSSIENLLNKTIKKVSDDLDNMKYNTAISALMILLNEMEKLGSITKKDYRTFIMLLNPVAPHLTEELNFKYSLGKPLCESNWPTYDESKTVDESYEMVVQINGKVRGKITVLTTTSNEEMEKLAMEIDNVQSYIVGAEILKVIVVPKKLVNIVIK